MTDSVDRLLKGHIMVTEVAPPAPGKRTWIEVALHEDDLPDYPFRKPPYAMTSGSRFEGKASPESRFKVRISTFKANDIEKGYDPSYDNVGDYIVLSNINEVASYLASHGSSIDKLVESSTTEYPL